MLLQQPAKLVCHPFLARIWDPRSGKLALSKPSYDTLRSEHLQTHPPTYISLETTTGNPLQRFWPSTAVSGYITYTLVSSLSPITTDSQAKYAVQHSAPDGFPALQQHKKCSLGVSSPHPLAGPLQLGFGSRYQPGLEEVYHSP